MKQHPHSDFKNRVIRRQSTAAQTSALLERDMIYHVRGKTSYPFRSPPESIDNSPFDSRTMSSKLCHRKSAKHRPNKPRNQLTKTGTYYTPSHQYKPSW